MSNILTLDKIQTIIVPNTNLRKRHNMIRTLKTPISQLNTNLNGGFKSGNLYTIFKTRSTMHIETLLKLTKDIISLNKDYSYKHLHILYDPNNILYDITRHRIVTELLASPGTFELLHITREVIDMGELLDIIIPSINSSGASDIRCITLDSIAGFTKDRMYVNKGLKEIALKYDVPIVTACKLSDRDILDKCQTTSIKNTEFTYKCFSDNLCNIESTDMSLVLNYHEEHMEIKIIKYKADTKYIPNYKGYFIYKPKYEVK